MNAEEIARGMDEAQKQALMNAVAFLDFAAGEGICMLRRADTPTISSSHPEFMGADDVIYDLWVQFGLPEPEDTYTDAFRDLLMKEKGHEGI